MSTSTYAPPGEIATPEAPSDSQPAENGVKEKKSGPRPYHVFLKVNEGTFQFLATKESTTPEGAIKALGLDVVQFGSTYAAVPVRNWTEKTPKRRPEDISF